MLNRGLTYIEEIDPRVAAENGFGRLEISLEQADKADELRAVGCEIIGITADAKTLYDEESFFNAVMKAKELGAGYLCLQTYNISNDEYLTDLLFGMCEFVADVEMRIIIENGYCSYNNGIFVHGAFSVSDQNKRLVDKLNDMCGKAMFGLALNVGNTALLGQNFRRELDGYGDLLWLVHANDNDAREDERQMPYTFSRGRGTLITRWQSLVGTMRRIGFSGEVVFDNVGTFKRTPKPLHGAMLKLMQGICESWDRWLTIEDRLGESGKHIILFGTGRMAARYMETFGKKYMPVFVVDNNRDNWGKEFYGVPVKSPEAILEVPEELRSVWISAMFYAQLGGQLDKMHIKYDYYCDEYDYDF